MKLLTLCAAAFALMVSVTSCTENHVFDNSADYATVQQDFAKRCEELPNGNLFSIVEKPGLSAAQKEALTFLYAYMPVADIADYPGEYYLEQVDCSLRAREEMPWGKVVPELEFRHFVLPIRVNNENLDHSRKVFYEELKDRVKNLSMHDAVLEINHWCHEKVVYQPSDGRTTSPLASIKTAYGRHGSRHACNGYSRASGLHPALGTHRRQPRLGRGLGRWQMVLLGCL